MKKFTLILAVVCFAFMTQAQNIPNWTKNSTPGSPLGGNVDYTLHDLLSAGNYVLLDFMATWCPPCQTSTPALNQLWLDYGEGAGGFYVFALDQDNSETAAQLDAFGVQYGGTYPAFITCGSDYSFYNTYWGAGGIPLFILLQPSANPTGNDVVWSQVGWSGGVPGAIENILNTQGGVFPTGIAGINAEEGIAIYPNPAVDNFGIFLKNIENVDVRIFSVTGQMVNTYDNVNNTLNVNTTDYNSGIYFVQIIEEDGTVTTQKVNVQK